ncbi:hypothetical protein [Streptomyces sp. NPDC005423]|uniref:hypothetical protein n=1 Tax=Streptomyces sp. NPDC005423 TaxID=3155343 RepID=UPI0033A89F92
MPLLRALANPKLDERKVLSAMLDREPHLATDRPNPLVIADKGVASRRTPTHCPGRFMRK